MLFVLLLVHLFFIPFFLFSCLLLDWLSTSVFLFMSTFGLFSTYLCLFWGICSRVYKMLLYLITICSQIILYRFTYSVRTLQQCTSLSSLLAFVLISAYVINPTVHHNYFCFKQLSCKRIRKLGKWLLYLTTYLPLQHSSFLCVDLSFFELRTLNISCSAGVLVPNPLRFCLSENSFIHPHFWRRYIFWVENSKSTFFFFQLCKDLLLCLS